MSMNPKEIGFASASLNPKGQTLEHLNHLVAQITKLVNCGNCGRIARLSVDFLGDPPPDFAKDHVISLQTGGFTGG